MICPMTDNGHFCWEIPELSLILCLQKLFRLYSLCTDDISVYVSSHVLCQEYTLECLFFFCWRGRYANTDCVCEKSSLHSECHLTEWKFLFALTTGTSAAQPLWADIHSSPGLGHLIFDKIPISNLTCRNQVW